MTEESPRHLPLASTYMCTCAPEYMYTNTKKENYDENNNQFGACNIGQNICVVIFNVLAMES